MIHKRINTSDEKQKDKSIGQQQQQHITAKQPPTDNFRRNKRLKRLSGRQKRRAILELTIECLLIVGFFTLLMFQLPKIFPQPNKYKTDDYSSRGLGRVHDGNGDDGEDEDDKLVNKHDVTQLNNFEFKMRKRFGMGRDHSSNRKSQQHRYSHKGKINNNDGDEHNSDEMKEEGEYLEADYNKISWGKSQIVNNKYRHSDVMKGIGDKSDTYSKMREDIDKILPTEDIDNDNIDDSKYIERLAQATQKARVRSYGIIDEASSILKYDVHNCPDKPPPSYPQAYNVLDVLDHWPTDDTQPRPSIYQGLCTFDYRTERHKAMAYRKAEVPFVIRDDPKVMRTVERWNVPDYLYKLLEGDGNKKYRSEYSLNNHFMYFIKPRNVKKKGTKQLRVGGKRNVIEKPEGWEAPTKIIKMSYADWLSHANVTDESHLADNNKEHWYFRLIGCGKMQSCDRTLSEYLFDELPFFQPRIENDMYMVNPVRQAGIHCRFGMKGVTAENHFDGSRNFIALLKGERRYLLSHPNQCPNLALYPRGHPSGRHSAVDWSKPDLIKYPEFQNALVNEVVLQAGDALYLPTHWFHHIVSLGLNFQCNTRSGINDDYADVIHKCGF